MKTNKNLLYCLLLIFIVSSCTIQKRKYASGYFVQKKITHSIKPSKRNKEENRIKPEELTLHKSENLTASSNTQIDAFINQETITRVTIYENSQDAQCAIITLKSGEKIEAFAVEVMSAAIRYKKCNNAKGPFYLLGKSEVSSIEYPDGSKQTFETETTIKANEQGTNHEYTKPNVTRNDEFIIKKMETLGIVGFFLALTGLLVGGIPLGTAAVVLGLISLGKIQKHPEKYKQRRIFAVLSILVGIMSIVGGILFVLVLL